MVAPRSLFELLEYFSERWVRRQLPHIQAYLLSPHLRGAALAPIVCSVSQFVDNLGERSFRAVCRAANAVGETARAFHTTPPRPALLLRRWWPYYEHRIQEIATQWREELPAVNVVAAQRLKTDLCASTRAGAAVHFGEPGARTAYILHRLRSRAMFLTQLLLDSRTAHVRTQLLSREALRIVSVGGGPGFDAAGFHLLADFFGANVAITNEIVDL